MRFLFLDDWREPTEATETKSGKNIWDLVTKEHHITELIIVKNCYDFCKWVEDNGVPDIVSFDYQLNEWSRARNGALCARELVRKCEDLGVPFPKYYIHTSDKQYAAEIERIIQQ